MTGSNGRDKIKGRDGDDTLLGLGGSDKLYGEDGNDQIDGGTGNDNIYGGDGDDTIEGGVGNDILNGGKGDDLITDTGGDDNVDAGSGNYTIQLADGDNKVKAKNGDDVVETGGGDDTIDAGDGNDMVTAGAGDDVVKGGAGADTVLAGGGRDIVMGDGSGGSGSGRGSGSHGASSSFDDYLDGGAGDDWIVGGTGADTVLGGSGDDVLFGDEGGNGRNWYRAGSTAEFFAGSGGHGSGSGRGSGGRHGSGSGRGSGSGHGSGSGRGGRGSASEGGFDDYLDGGSGNDFVFAGGGNDTVVHGGTENVGATDIYAGGAGIDTLDFYLTQDQHEAAASEIAAYQAFLAANTDPVTGEANNASFTFASLDLTVRAFENVSFHTANDDAVSVSEDASATVFASVLDNDFGASDVVDVRLVPGSAPALGVLSFNDPATGQFNYDPAGAFEDLAVGESAEVSFEYEVEFANGRTDTATVTITITGENDDPTITVTGAAAIKEAVDAAPQDLSDTGTVSFDDIDESDVIDIGFAFNNDIVWSGGVLDAGVAAVLEAGFATGAAGVDAPGSTSWTYAATAGLDFLSVGDTLSWSYTVTADDGNGGTASEVVSFTVTGTNDAPTLAAGILAADEDGAAVVLNLSALGDDVDSDDVGGTLTYTISGQPAEGAASITGSELSFNPGADFQDLAEGETRDVIIQITATDAHGATAVNDVTVTVTGTNDAPVITSDAAAAVGAVTESGADADGAIVAAGVPTATGTLTSSDVDTGATARWSGDATGTYGAIAIDPTSGVWTYTLDNADGDTESLAAGQVETESFTMTVTDDQGATAEETVTVTITGTNDAPVLGDQRVTLDEDQQFSGQFVATDVDAGDGLTYDVITPGRGVLDVQPDGRYTYTAMPDFNGIDVIGVNVSDGNGGFDTAQITFDISAVNDAPVITADVRGQAYVSTPASSYIEVAHSDDLRPDSWTIEAWVNTTDDSGGYNRILSAPVGGGQSYSLVVRDGEAHVRLDNGSGRQVQGEDVADGQWHHIAGTFDTATNILTLYVDGAFVGETDVGTGAVVTGSQPIRIGSFSDSFNTTGLDGLISDVRIWSEVRDADQIAEFYDQPLEPSKHDALELYLPLDGSVQDISGNGRTVTSVNVSFAQSDAPIDGVFVAAEEAIQLGAISVSDVDVGIADVEVTVSAANGTVSFAALTDLSVTAGANGSGTVTVQGTLGAVNAALAALSYTGDAEGAGSVTVAVSDLGNSGAGGALETVLTIDVSVLPPLNSAPVIGDATGGTGDEDTVITGQLVATDEDGDTLSFTLLTDAANGSVEVSANGSYSYAPSANFNGTDSFTYEVRDGNGGVDSATVQITVDAVNDAPELEPITAAAAEAQSRSGSDSSGAVAVPNAGYFWLLDFDTGEMTVVARTSSNLSLADNAPENGVVFTINPNGGIFRDVDPNTPGDQGDPNATPNNFVISAASYDAGLETLIPAEAISLPGYAGYSAVYQDFLPEMLIVHEAFSGDVVIEIEDLPYQGGTASAQFTAAVTFTGTNDIVSVSGVEARFDTDLPARDVVITPTATDVEGDALTASVDDTLAQGDVTLNANGTVTYNAGRAFEYLAEGETATDSFTYTVDDGNGGTATETVVVTVTGTNDAPVAEAIDAGSADEDDGAVTIDLLSTATDVDGDALSIGAVVVTDDQGAVLVFTDNGDGTITVDPAQYGDTLDVGDLRQVSVSYEISDGAVTVAQVATLELVGVANNLAPTAQNVSVAAETGGFEFATDPVLTQQRVSLQEFYQNGSYQNEAVSDYSPVVVGLGEGGYAVVWLQADREVQGSSIVSSEDQVAVQRYGADDQPIGDIMTFGEVDQSRSSDDLDRSYEYNPRVVSLEDGGFAMVWEGNYRSYSGTTQVRYERDIFVQKFDATGIPVGNEPIQVSQTVPVVNGSTTAYGAFGDFSPDVTALADGGFAVVWRGVDYYNSTTSYDGTTSEQSVYVQAYDKDGAALGTTAALGELDQSYGNDNRDRFSDSNPKIAASSDGTYVVVWQASYSAYSGTSLVEISNDIMAQRFAADGTAQGSSFQVSETVAYQSGARTEDAHRDYNPEISALDGGGYVIAWYGSHSEYNSSNVLQSTDDNIYLRVISAEGQPVSEIVFLGLVDRSYSADNQDRAADYSPKVASMTDGGFVVTWYGNYYGYSGTTQTEFRQDVFVQRFDASGTALAPAQQVSVTDGRVTGNYTSYDNIRDSEAQVTELLGGGFVVAWQSFQEVYENGVFESNSYVIEAQRFDASGVAAGELMTLGTVDLVSATGQDRFSDYTPRITALSDGGFAVAWQSYENLYDASGSYIGQAQDVYVAAVHAGGGGSDLGDPVLVDVGGLISDDDLQPGESLTVTVAQGSNGSSATVDGTVISLQANAAYYAALGLDETEEETFTYTVRDGRGGSAEATITLTVTGNNDDPEAVDVVAATLEDSAGITISAEFTDVDVTDTHSFVVNTNGTQGTVTNNGDGTFDYAPNGAFESLAAGQTATDTFSYTVRDGNGGSSVAQVTVTVTGQNDGPSALDARISNGTVFAEAPETNQQQVSDTDAYVSGSQTYDGNGDNDPAIASLGNGGYVVAWSQRDGTYSGSTRTDFTQQIAVQIFDSEHNPVGERQTFGEIDKSYSSDSYDRAYDDSPQLVELAGGGFALTWAGTYYSYSGTTATRYERDIFTQMFSAEGIALSASPIVVSQTVYATTGGNSQYDAIDDFTPEVAGLADGGLAITWRSTGYDISGGNFVSNSRSNDIVVRAFDADGTARGTEVVLGSDDRSYGYDNIDRHYEYNQRIAASEDGSFAVVWRGQYNNYSNTTFTGRTNDVYLQLFDADGQTVGATVQVSETETYTTGSQTNDAVVDTKPDVTALADGGYAVTWQTTQNTYSGSSFVSSEDKIAVRVYGVDGTPVSAEVLLGAVDQSYTSDNVDRAYDTNAQVVALEDGGFVVTWETAYNAYSGSTRTEFTRDIAVQRFDADGAPRGETQQISETILRPNGSEQIDAFSDYTPVIIDLVGGGFAVAWNSIQQVYDGSTFVSEARVIQVQLFDVLGDIAGEPITVGTVNPRSTGYDQTSDYNPELTALSDGGFAVVWPNNTSYYDSSGAYTGYEEDISVAAVNPISDASLSESVTVDVAGQISDIDLPGDALTVSVDAQGSNGSTATVEGTVISIQPNLALYAPLAKGETVEETFSYTVTDVSGETASATVIFTVRGENDAPVIEQVSVTAPDTGTLSFSDVDNNDMHSVSVTDATVNGDASLLGTADVFEFIDFGEVDQVADQVDWTASLSDDLLSNIASGLSDGDTLQIVYDVAIADLDDDSAVTQINLLIDSDGLLI